MSFLCTERPESMFTKNDPYSFLVFEANFLPLQPFFKAGKCMMPSVLKSVQYSVFQP